MPENTLPGKADAYIVRAFQGPRCYVGGLHVTTLARFEDNDGNYALNVLSGGKGAGLPVIRHASARVAMFVLTGRLALHAAGKTRILGQGDLAVLPKGTDYGFVCLDHRTVFKYFSTGGDVGAVLREIGEPTETFMPHENPASPIPALEPGTTFAAADTSVVSAYPADAPAEPACDTALPGSDTAFFLMANEGDRLVAAEQLFTIKVSNTETGGDFIAVMGEGPMGEMIPPHFHEKHHEMFFCIEGQLKLRVNDDYVMLSPGDWAAVPPGTVHAFQHIGAYTRHFGFLVTGLFEPFFRTLGDAYPYHVAPAIPGPFRFDRVIEKVKRGELDLKPLMMGPPQ